MSRFVVAGVTGRVGGVVARQLLERRERVTVLVRDPARGAAWSARGATVAVGSLADERFLASIVSGADGFFTLLPENVDPSDFHGHRRRMADAITAAVRRSNVPRVVLLSAIAAGVDEGFGPARDLRYLEGALQQVPDTAVTAVRAAAFQENIAMVLPAAQHEGIYPHFMTSPDAAFPMVATRDVGAVVAAELQTATMGYDTVDVLGPVYTTRALAERLGVALGKPLRIVTIPPEQHVPSLVAAGVPMPVAEAVAELFAAIADGRVRPAAHRRVVCTSEVDDILRDLIGIATAAA